MSTNPDTPLKTRLTPFLALLDARYSPLICAALPQAYTVYRWLYAGSDHSAEAWIFAIIGALGFEMIYVGAIAWAEVKGRTQTAWFWLTALTALIFSVLVALRVYLPHEAEWAILHSGFPIVAFSYTMLIHKASAVAPEKEDGQWQRWQEWGAAMQQQLTAMQNRLASERAAFASERAALVTEFEMQLDARAMQVASASDASGAVQMQKSTASDASDATQMQKSTASDASGAIQVQLLRASDASDATQMQLLRASDASDAAADGGAPSPDFFRSQFQQQPDIALLQEAYLAGVAEGTLKSWVQRYAKQWKWAEVAPQVRRVTAMQAS